MIDTFAKIEPHLLPLSVEGITGREVTSRVSMDEYRRLLQLPRNQEIEGDLLDRTKNARTWYAENGHPFVSAVRVDLQNMEGASVFLVDGSQLQSPLLAERLRAGGAYAVVVLAASAGCEVASETARLWGEGRPDEAFFLDRFAVAVTELLVFQASTMFCQTSSLLNETLLPHLSPGCGGWDLQDQQKLMVLLIAGSPRGTRHRPESEMTLGPLTLLPSGALDPQYSMLAVLGVTRKTYDSSPRDLCRSCDLNPCSFRRAPFREGALQAMEAK